MKLLHITETQSANLETATIVSPEDEGGAIKKTPKPLRTQPP